VVKNTAEKEQLRTAGRENKSEKAERFTRGGNSSCIVNLTILVYMIPLYPALPDLDNSDTLLSHINLIGF